MSILYGFFVFAFGAVVGSFLNVVLLRKNTGESIVFGGSRCFSCGRGLKALELIPILSFLWQHGRCRNCGSRISLQYPVIEFLTGMLVLAVYIKSPYALSYMPYGPWLMVYGFFYFIAFAALLLVAVYDFRTKIIDSIFLYIFGFFALVAGALRWFENYTMISDDLASSFFIALFFYFMWFVSKGTWMGRGDADLAFFTSLFLGFPQNIIMLLVSFWVGGIVGVFLLALKNGKYSLKSELPFGPFLAVATFLIWYAGPLYLW